MTSRTRIVAGRHTVQYGTTPITFDLLYSARKTIAVRVYPDQAITVDAPEGTPLDKVQAFVRQHGAWIRKKMPAEPQRVSLPRQYVSGESYRYLGRQYVLKVESGLIARVRLTRDHLIVQTPDVSDKAHIAAVIDAWYRRHAERIFAVLLTDCYPRVAAFGVPFPALSIRPMKTKWGSCTSKGRVTLNLKLIQAPLPLIRYVMLHELCHLKELNHSPQFWRLLTRVLPDWQALRAELNRYEFNASA